MLKSSEGFQPNPECLQRIRNIGESMAPYIADNIWAQRYIAGNTVRIAFDLEHVERFIPTSGLILDIGSIPALLTTALHQQGLQVEGLDLDPARFSSVIEKIGLTIKAG